MLLTEGICYNKLVKLISPVTLLVFVYCHTKRIKGLERDAFNIFVGFIKEGRK
jgi:hypothetical protein